jgi:hypothetical protein
MKSFPGPQSAIFSLAFAMFSCASSGTGSPGASGGSSNQGNGGAGGNATSLGGDTNAGGNGTGGAQSSGGTANAGGANATGGTVATGGTIATGGTKATGGTVATGGTQAAGGTTATGGTKAGGGGTTTAGGTVATGGMKATGGTVAMGGTTATGGIAATGGTKATGGTVATGGTNGTGGSSAGACTYTGSGNLTDSNGELTCYYFGQGSASGPCMGSTTFKTNCGYCGTEGTKSGGACDSSHNDAVANISTGSYFAAVADWGQGASCGLCVSVSYGGKTITATVVDNCASCGSGHIDLSSAAGAALGMGTGPGQTEDPKSGVTWKTVACPVGTNSIVAVYNGIYAGQLYFQNVAFPIASASAIVGGTTYNAALTNGMWDFHVTLTPGTQITLKDIAGQTVIGTFGSNGASLGVQFPTTC